MSDSSAVDVGLAASATYTVAESDTARWLGSGDLEVLATPRLLAWMEAVTCRALERALTPGRTSVGKRIGLEHLQASPCGTKVEVVARVTHVEGRELRLEAVATMGDRVCGRAEITRVVVDRDRFMERLT